MLEDLVTELRLAGEGGQGAVVGLAQEFHLAGFRQGLETGDHFRSEALELLQGAAGDGIGDLEFALALPDQVQHELVHGQVTLLGDAAEDGPVGKVIVIMGVFADIEKSVQAEPGGLMDLEIQADALSCHNRLFYY